MFVPERKAEWPRTGTSFLMKLPFLMNLTCLVTCVGLGCLVIFSNTFFSKIFSTSVDRLCSSQNLETASFGSSFSWIIRFWIEEPISSFRIKLSSPEYGLEVSSEVSSRVENSSKASLSM